MRAIIIDNDEKSWRSIIATIRTFKNDIDIVAQTGTVKEALDLIKKYKPQIVILDVYLADGSGFDLLRKIGNINFEIIFTSAVMDHVLKAYKFNAIDYILKPIKPNELKAALQKVSM